MRQIVFALTAVCATVSTLVGCSNFFQKNSPRETTSKSLSQAQYKLDDGSLTVGVNVGGFGGWGSAPATLGREYWVMEPANIAYLSARGVKLVRIPFRWEAMQPVLGQDLEPGYIAALKQSVAAYYAAGIRVQLDVHNYAQYSDHLSDISQGGQIPLNDGTGRLTTAHFVDLWVRLSNVFKNTPAIYGYDLMNEPFGLPNRDAYVSAVKAVISAIRANSDNTKIVIEGYGQGNWAAANYDFPLDDPANNLEYSYHVYADYDGSGSHDRWVDSSSRISEDILVARAVPFIEWCTSRELDCQIGETAVGNDNDAWLVILDRFYSYLRAQPKSIPVLSWNYDPRGANDGFNLYPWSGSEPKQWTVMRKYNAGIPVTAPAPGTSVPTFLNQLCQSGSTCLYEHALEGEQYSIGCSAGTMTINDASYGSGSKSISCLDAIANACNGKGDCPFAVSAGACGSDPAPGLVKLGSTTVTCSGGATVAPVPPSASSASVQISMNQTCPAGATCDVVGAVENGFYTMSCSSGSINVNNATYGAGSQVVSCVAAVSAACNGKTSCTVGFSNGACGADPAWGVVKSGSANITCSSSSAPAPTASDVSHLNFGSTCSTGTCNYDGALENANVSLACATGRLTITDATYGDPSSGSTNCVGPISAVCNGNSQCTVQFSNSRCGGDPAPGIVKSGSLVAVCSE